VTQITPFTLISGYSLAGVMQGYLYEWRPDGQYMLSEESDHDLFMAPIIRTGWIARFGYPHCSKSYVVGQVYDSEEDAKAMHPRAAGYHQIELEE
jgi:hypothetical protein